MHPNAKGSSMISASARADGRAAGEEVSTSNQASQTKRPATAPAKVSNHGDLRHRANAVPASAMEKK